VGKTRGNYGILDETEDKRNIVQKGRQMRSLQAKEYFDLRVVQSEIKKPSYGEVLLKVLACGVCGSDVHMMKRAKVYSALGHEIAAQVVETGPGAMRFKPGDTVIVEDVAMCGHCRACNQGRSDLCRNFYSLGKQSGMGDYLTVHENSLIPYEGIEPWAACLTEPLAVSLNAYFAAELPPSGKLAVFGMGVLGLMCVRLAKNYGASKVVCVGSNKGSARNIIREETAYKMGADAVVYSDKDAEKEVEEALGSKAEAVIVTSPPKTLPTALKTAEYGAKVSVIGLDFGSEAEALIDVDKLILNKNSIIPVFAEPAKLFPLSYELIKTGVIDPKLLVTHKFKLEETDKLRGLFIEDKPVIKAVMIAE